MKESIPSTKVTRTGIERTNDRLLRAMAADKTIREAKDVDELHERAKQFAKTPLGKQL